MLENRNLLLAIILSMAVLFGWQLLIGGPAYERAQKEQQRIAEQQAADAAAQAPQGQSGPALTPPGAAAPGAVVSPSLTRDEALAASERIEIRTERLLGSINLTGARIDDLRLTDFHETVDPASPTIVLLSPEKGPDAYFAEFGWAGADASGPYPGPATQWSAPAGATLTKTQPLTLTYDNGSGLTFTRTVSIDDHYLFTITDTVANNGDQAATIAPLGRIIRVGTPKSQGYWILHEGLIGVTDSLHEVGYGGIKDAREMTWDNVADGGWLGITDKYWAAVLIPDQKLTYDGRYAYSEQPTPIYQTDFRGQALAIAPGGAVEQTSHLFAGAKQVSLVDGYAEALDIRLFDRLIDWGWFWFFTKPLFYFIDWFFHLFGNFGLAILAVTVVVKAAFFPLANKSYASMSAMKKIQPKIVEIREKYKDDKVKQQQLQMELFKKEKVNPLAGCWPIAIQIPVFFALYKVLFVTIEMRHAPFFGWIKDLSAPDPTSLFNLFGLIPLDPSTVPLIGGLLMLGAWPIVMGVTMFIQMKLNPTPPDPTQAMIFTWMPVVFTCLLASFPAGLVIYWAWNNTLSVTQQYLIMRRNGVEVDLFGNIASTFRGGKPAPPGAKKAPGEVKVANEPAPAAGEADEMPSRPATAQSAKAKKGRARSGQRNKPRGPAPAKAKG